MPSDALIFSTRNARILPRQLIRQRFVPTLSQAFSAYKERREISSRSAGGNQTPEVGRQLCQRYSAGPQNAFTE